MSDEPFVLYGGPLPAKMDDDSEELGEIILKKFDEHGDKVIYVSNPYLIVVWNKIYLNLIWMLIGSVVFLM